MANLNEKPHLLVAEGDDASRDSLKRYLESSGWIVDSVADGEGALKAAKDARYDVIITDLAMPGFRGLDLLKKLKHINPNHAIIVVTDNQDTREVVEVMRQGATDCLPRPVDFSSIHDAISRIIDGSRNSSTFVPSSHDLNAEYSYEVKTHEVVGKRFPLDILEAALEREEISSTRKLRIELAFQEALTNAVEHGNLELESSWKEELDPSGVDRYSLIKAQRVADEKYRERKVKIELKLVDSILEIAITDSGKGFEHNENRQESAADSQDPLCYGRGLSLIKSCVQDVRYEQNGRKIILTTPLKEQE